MPAKGPFNFASGSDTFFQTRRPKSLLDIAVPGPAASELTVSTPYLGPTFVTPDSPTSSSLHQLLAETTTSYDILASSTVGAPESYAQQPTGISSPDTQQRELNPFLSHPHSDIMFPSLGSVVDTLLDDKSLLKLEVDAMGCAHLPASEFTLTLESDCNFHYEFWDGFYQEQYCLPIDLALLLDPSRAHLYEFYALATPFVTKIAVRLTSVTVPTRFTRLTPKPPLPVFDQDTNISSTQIYTTSYRGSILKPPKKSEQPDVFIPSKGIYLSPNWERIAFGTTTSKNDTLSSTGISSTKSSSEEKENKKSELVKRGFTLRAWIPIPTSLFENRETCTFRIDARTWIDDPYRHSNDNAQGFVPKPRRHRQEMGKNGSKWEIGHFSDEDQSLVSTGCDVGEMLVEASRVVTVSHLQRRRDM